MAKGTVTLPRTRAEIAEDLANSRDLLRLARFQLDHLREDLGLAQARVDAIITELSATGGAK